MYCKVIYVVLKWIKAFFKVSVFFFLHNLTDLRQCWETRLSKDMFLVFFILSLYAFLILNLTFCDYKQLAKYFAEIYTLADLTLSGIVEETMDQMSKYLKVGEVIEKVNRFFPATKDPNNLSGAALFHNQY